MSDDAEQSMFVAAQLMLQFAERTGLSSVGPQRRYLWTDAFAVGNFIGLARATHDDRYTALALRVVESVHGTLGRHRADDRRSGWLSGLDEHEGAAHPTRGGLRIGKPLPEREPDEPFDAELEWERDGQYFHYLTQWMHALDQLSRFLGDPRFNRWARELAETAYAAFSGSFRGVPHPALVWKMSIDLSRPLVASTGSHDALEGYITALELRATASGLAGEIGGPSLCHEIGGFEAMLKERDWATPDPLGLGGLLTDALRVGRLLAGESNQASALLPTLLESALAGLGVYAPLYDASRPASARLAFRELGLSIGCSAAGLLEQELGVRETRARALLGEIEPYRALGASLRNFWLQPAARRAPTWVSHQDINDVMLATSLLPASVMFLPSFPPRQKFDGSYSATMSETGGRHEH